ncbi:ATP-binding protein [Gemmatimonas sp.]|uniref:hybrid sensor histidine kinase/response regulator n=1 Tax=Gemmatimonas sp. TaxID=1962908 RepID=UPI00286B2DE5|nr:ATP-binding protein [Gemmatimonas sp.]
MITNAESQVARVVGYVADVADVAERHSSESDIQRYSERLRRLSDIIVAFNVAVHVGDVVQGLGDELLSLCAADRVDVDVLRGARHTEHHAIGVAPAASDTIGGDASEPLRIRLAQRDGSPLGELVLSRAAAPFTSDEVSIAVQVAQVAAVTIENLDLIDALREADQRKDRFLATLAHELRNPLTPIVNAVAMLERVAGSHSGVARAKATIDRQSSQLVRLIDDLMDVSRVTQDRLELRREVVLMRDVFELAFEAVRPMIIERNLHLTVNMPNESIGLFVDPARLAQALTNILSNAVKYTDANGDILVAVHITADAVRIEVSDTGIGIPAEQLEHVFQMFSRVYDHGSRMPAGLGIGLALARRLVEMHGGTMTAHSAGAGQGSTFRLTLPRVVSSDVHHEQLLKVNADRSSASAELSDIPLPMSTPRFVPLVAGRRVLVVDDNIDAADSLALLLEREGHQVSVAYDGEHAVRVYAEQHPEAVVMDIGLPLLDGYEAARAMRMAQGAHSLLLIALTGWGQGEDRRRSQEAGFDHHLVKPISPRTIHALLVEHTRLAPAAPAS